MSTSLPIKRDLTLAYLSSFIIALLMLVASVAGLFSQAHLYPEKQLLSFASTDGSTLIISLPILLGSLWLARRGSLFGLLCWPGALLYVLYTYMFYVISVPFSALFLPYLALVTLSAYTIIGLVANVDSEVVQQRLSGRVPARIAGGLLTGIAVLLMGWEVSAVVTALASRASIDPQTSVTWVVDLTVACPTLLIGGILLWRCQPIGYVIGAGLLLQIGALFMAVPVLMVLRALFAASLIDGLTVVLLLVIGALPFVLLAFFARGAARGQRMAALATQNICIERTEVGSERRSDEHAWDELVPSRRSIAPSRERKAHPEV